MDLDLSSPSGQNPLPGVAERVVLDPVEPLKTEEDEQTGMAERLKEEEEERGEPSGQLTSSRMCVSLLAEGSSLRCDSSMQVGSWPGPCRGQLVHADVIVCSGGQRLQHHVSRGRQSHRLGESLQRAVHFQPAGRSLSGSSTPESNPPTLVPLQVFPEMCASRLIQPSGLLFQVFYPHL